MNQRRLRPLILLPIVLLTLVSLPTAASAGPNSRTIKVSDDCDTASFDAAFGAGTCVGDGETTVADFVAQLMANGNVPNEAVKDWDFSREQFGVDRGARLTLVNQGGEFHTFTEVPDFTRGGCAPPVNALLGLEPALDCSDAKIGASALPAGVTRTFDPLQRGVHHFQCLIHPWMQSTAIVG